MLNLYDSFNVPEVPHVQIYRDDDNPHKFYMMSSRPIIARDDTNDPMFNFILFARDADRLPPDDLEVQRGYLQLSVQAGVSPEEEKKIREHLKQRLNGEVGRGYRYLNHLVTKIEPELSYPPVYLDDGTVELSALGDTGGGMVKQSSGSKQPSLSGANTATFSMLLTQEGSELFRQALLKNIFPATVFYKLKFPAIIPAIKIHMWGNLSEIYTHVKDLITVQHTKTRDGKLVYRRTWQEIGSITEFRQRIPSLHVEIDDRDFREGSAGEDVTKKLEEVALAVLQNNIIPSLFKEPIAGVSEEESKDKWLQNVKKTEESSFDVTFQRSDTVNIAVNPNAILTQMLTPAEVAAKTVYVDLGDPFFKEIDVKVHANVNFAADPIFALKVFLDYDQQDDIRGVRIKKAKELLFKNGDQVQRFRQVMAKGADQAPKDEYSFWSEIVYKDTGETVRVPKTGAIKTRERELVISYRRLGFVKVNLILGAQSEQVKAVQVTVRYPNISAAAAQQSFELTREKPLASYFTYTGAEDVKPYFYKLTYVLTNGQRMDLPEQTAQAETIVIPDPFEKSVATRFLAQADFGVVEKIVVDARYTDSANDFSNEHHAELTGNGESSAWTLQLRDPNQRDFEYDVLIVFKNGAQERQNGLKRLLSGTIPVGIGATDALDVTVIPSLIDWNKYRLAIVSLTYSDEANNVSEEKSFTFRRDESADQQWRVLLRDPLKKEYKFRSRLFAVDGGENKDTDWQTSKEDVLVIE